MKITLELDPVVDRAALTTVLSALGILDQPSNMPFVVPNPEPTPEPTPEPSKRSVGWPKGRPRKNTPAYAAQVEQEPVPEPVPVVEPEPVPEPVVEPVVEPAPNAAALSAAVAKAKGEPILVKAEAPTSNYTHEGLRDLLIDYVAVTNTQQGRDLLADFGLRRISELLEHSREDQDEFVAICQRTIKAAREEASHG